jgi:hypothetical protein
VQIAAKLDATPAQVLIAWGIYRGYSVIPKSVQENRIESNFKQVELGKSDYEQVSESGLGNHTRHIFFSLSCSRCRCPNVFFPGSTFLTSTNLVGILWCLERPRKVGPVTRSRLHDRHVKHELRTVSEYYANVGLHRWPYGCQIELYMTKLHQSFSLSPVGLYIKESDNDSIDDLHAYREYLKRA